VSRFKDVPGADSWVVNGMNYVENPESIPADKDFVWS
jgi:hypothetical protein